MNDAGGKTVLARNSRLKRSGGFTLVELLVVVSIIALLISILLPSLRRARDAAKMAKCLANMRGMGQAVVVFSNDHNDRFQLTATEAGVDSVDPSRNRFAYDSGGEILAWTVAIAQGAGMSYQHNWNWGVRANGADQAEQREDHMDDQLELTVCPSDKVKIASPWYPNDDGLRGTGDPNNPIPTGSQVGYWGYLSYAINEDITGTEVVGSGPPACWRSVKWSGGVAECMGEQAYNPRLPCGQSGEYGRRLQGRLDKAFRPGEVGLVFEAGPDEKGSREDWLANLVFSATPAATLQQYAGPYLSNFQRAQQQRMPRKRHMDRKINVLYADTHGGSARPVRFDPATDLPLEYAPRVRVSPYAPTGYTGE